MDIDIALDEFWNHTSINSQELIFENNYYQITQIFNFAFVIIDKTNNIIVKLKPNNVEIIQYNNILEVNENNIYVISQSTMYDSKIFLKERKSDNEYIFTYHNIDIIKLRFYNNYLNKAVIFDNFYYNVTYLANKLVYELKYKYPIFTYLFTNNHDNYKDVYRLGIIDNNKNIIYFYINYTNNELILIDKNIVQDNYVTLLGKRQNILEENSAKRSKNSLFW